MVRASLGAAIALAACFLLIPRAAAAPKRPASGADEQALSSMLWSPEPDEIRMGLEMAVASPRTAALAVARMRFGLPHAMLRDALEAIGLAGTGTDDVVALLSDLTRHRANDVRVRAIQTLAALRAHPAEGAIAQRLSDAAPEVREAAALALSELGSSASTALLVRAVQRNVAGASRALGHTLIPAELSGTLSSLGEVPFVALTDMFDALLLRKDLDDKAKVQIVASVAAIASAEARGYLEGAPKRISLSPRLRTAVDEAVRSMLP